MKQFTFMERTQVLESATISFKFRLYYKPANLWLSLKNRNNVFYLIGKRIRYNVCKPPSTVRANWKV